MIGEARGNASITPERAAINLDDFPIPENAGNCPREESCVESGPAAYFSTLPIVAIRDALEEGIPAAISNPVSTYVCNHLFYHVMHHLAQTNSHAQAGFMHIPVFLAKRLGATNGLDLRCETIIQAVRVAIEGCLSLYVTSAARQVI
jgi:pyroglutamyl-peptidase